MAGHPSEQLSRREVLGGFLGLGGAKVFEKLLPAEALQRAEEASRSEAEIEPNEARQLLEDIIESYMAVDTRLSRGEIERTLQRLPFLRDQTVKVEYLPVDDAISPYERDTFERTLATARANGVVAEALTDHMQVVAVNDLYQMGIRGATAIYDVELNVIVIEDERNRRDKRRSIDELLYKRYVDHEYTQLQKPASELFAQKQRVDPEFQAIDKELERIRRSTPVGVDWRATPEYRTKMEDFDRVNERLLQSPDIALIEAAALAWKEQMLANPHTLENIPDEFLRKNSDSLIYLLDSKIKREVVATAQTKLGLPHEAFHWFVANDLGKPGYDGPPLSNILYTALEQTLARYQPAAAGDFSRFTDPDYAPDVVKHLGTVLTPASVMEFCQTFAANYDLTHPPVLGADSTPNEKRHYDIAIFFTEYLARIYNGAIGNTEEHEAVETNRALVAAGFKGDHTSKSFRNIAHTPNNVELALLASMRWQGTPLIP